MIIRPAAAQTPKPHQTLVEIAKLAQDEAKFTCHGQMGSDGNKPDGNIETSPVVIAPSEPKEPSALPAIAAKADDLEEIKKSVEDAASVSGGLWLSYLFVLSYIAIAAGAVTHEDLLLIRAVKLPFLNVELPLKAFFALAPFVVLIIHAYALMHFVMLGKKASRFHNELRRQLPDSETNAQKSGARNLARALRGFGLGLAGVMSLAALWFSIVVATIPGEWQESKLALLDPPRWRITYVKDGKEETSGSRLTISCSRAR